ncbi:MAG: PAS domain S-box protein [Deltaproteobacteria bacterium]|nr:PAS domain S-box protein [Deltaproteobacteria bacterium]
MSKELYLQKEIKKLTEERNLFAKLLEESNLKFEGKIKELSLLKRIGDIISDSFNIKSFCRNLVQIIIEETDAENCSLLLKERGSKNLTLKVAYGIRDESIAFFEDLKESKVIFTVGEGIAGKVALEGKAIMINDVSQDKRFDHSNKRNLPIGSILCCPIMVQNEILGVINISNSHTSAFTSDDMRSITIFSAFASSILNNAILFNELSGVNEKLEKAFNNLMNTEKQLKLEIDERKQAQYELKKSKDFLENIFKTSVDGIIVADPEGYITIVNEAVGVMLGCSRDGLVGKHTTELGFKEKEDGMSEKELAEKLLNEGTVSGIERTWQNRDGNSMDVEMNFALLKNGAGDITGSVASIRDITKRKEAEHNLIGYQKRLKTLTKELILSEQKQRQYFADYLHDEIGQQLFATRLQLEQLKESLSSPKEKSILSNTLNDLKKMIDHSRSLTTELSPPILYELGLEKALEWLAEQTQKKYDITVTFHSDKRKKPLEDEVKIFLYQAASELLLNVVKHAKTKSVNISVKKDNSNIRISVEDSGIGFNLQTIHSADNKSEGVGIFRITERLNQLGGELVIQSQPNCGTRITLLAPLNSSS